MVEPGSVVVVVEPGSVVVVVVPGSVVVVVPSLVVPPHAVNTIIKAGNRIKLFFMF